MTLFDDDIDRACLVISLGLTTRFEQAVLPGLIRIWCGSHQLDLIMQEFFKVLLDEKFYTTLTTFVGYLRRQQNLISEMKTQAKKLQDTRWESMYRTSSWFKVHRIAVCEYVQQKRPSCAPSMVWWIVIIAIEKISGVASIAAKALQGHTTLVSQQRSAFETLTATLIDFFNIRFTSAAEREALAADDNSITSSDGRFSVSVVDVRGFLQVGQLCSNFFLSLCYLNII